MNPQKLTDLEVPSLNAEQIDKFTLQSIHSEAAGPFDVSQFTKQLAAKDGQRVIGADFGGDKGSTRLFEVRNRGLVILDDYADDIQGDDGQGYVQSLKKTAAYADKHHIPIGISWGGPIKNGSELVFHPKAKIFMSEMQAQFDGNLANLTPNVKAVINDGPAGLIQGAVEAYKTHGSTSVLFVINGGGLNIAVLSKGQMFATEAGHIVGIDALNTYQQTSSCGVFGAEYTCLEQLGANKAGIEQQWLKITGNRLSARNIEVRYKESDVLAGQLYEHSALVVANMIQGTANSFDIDIMDKQTVIVCHGGAFKFPNYGDRVQQMLSSEVTSPLLIMTKDYTDPRSNACLDGAALAALTNI